MARYTRNSYVVEFPVRIQNEIRKMVRLSLMQYGFTKRELDGFVRDAMNSRLVDLKDNINVNYILQKANGVR